MFVFSVKANKPKLIIILCIVVVVLVTAVLLIARHDKPTANDGGISLKASDESERIAFLSQFGWKVKEDPVEVSEIIIPNEFDDTYSAYNEIQKLQDMDLSPYKGEWVKKWVYAVKNYPGYGDDSDCIRATLLVRDGMVIGGDVSSLELDGFTQGFDFPEKTAAETTSAAA
ncbi:MAG: DUF4830 domain-containing protein [Clostridia bacterium]|nr:DUF4830 domain-containing protein [Clostridia bacterium]